MGASTRSAPALIDTDVARFIQGGVSVVVAGRDAALVPDVVRGCGCRVSHDRRRVTVLVEPSRAGELLDDLRTTGTIAVVFSQPSTHRTIQLKGTDAKVVEVSSEDLQVVERHLQAWIAELVSIGYRADFAAAVRGGTGSGIKGIVFTPTAAFEQTPGPAAGQRLGATA